MGKRTFKIVLLGDSSTGKTSIIDRFVNNKFEEKDNVHQSLSSPQLELISLARTSHITVLPADFNFGTLQVNRDIEVSFQVILKTPFAQSLSLISQVSLLSNIGSETLLNLESWIDLFRGNKG